MKNFTLAYLCLILSMVIFISCNKDLKNDIDTTAEVHSFNSSANITSAGSHFGVLTNAAYANQKPSDADTLTLLTFQKKLELASYYGVKYIRMSITHDAWVTTSGSTNFINNFAGACNAGFSVLLNVNYTTPSVKGPSRFADANAYGVFLKSVLDKLAAQNPSLKPALVVVENEETNANYFTFTSTADADRYINLLKVAIAECAPRDIKVSNGGITNNMLTVLTWDWMKTKYGLAAATLWASNIMAPNLYNTLNSPDILNYIKLAKYTVEQYATLQLSYVNIHWYEPLKASQYATSRLGNPFLLGVDSTQITNGALDSCVSYLNETLNGLSVITNETGQVNKSNRLTGSILNKYFSYQASGSNFPIVSWYDGDADGATNAKALHNGISSDSFNIRIAGTTFHNHLTQ